MAQCRRRRAWMSRGMMTSRSMWCKRRQRWSVHPHNELPRPRPRPRLARRHLHRGQRRMWISLAMCPHRLLGQALLIHQMCALHHPKLQRRPSRRRQVIRCWDLTFLELRQLYLRGQPARPPPLAPQCCHELISSNRSFRCMLPLQDRNLNHSRTTAARRLLVACNRHLPNPSPTSVVSTPPLQD